MRSRTDDYEKAYLTEEERERMYTSNPICRGYDDNPNAEGGWGEIRPN